MPNNFHLRKVVNGLVLLVLLSACGVAKSLRDVPNIDQYSSTIPERTQLSDSSFSVGNNFLIKNRQGLWEMYVDGNPFEIGLKTGSLTRELFNFQESTFVDKIDELVPSKGKQNLLKKFLAWYNRKMYLNVDEQYKTEIYGISRYASNDYDYIAEPYKRVLYFHGAHDIGHALQDLALVGCSSFATWGDHTEDGKLLIARNFDFYVNDEFSKNKIIAFISPERGYKFMSVTWAGFIGVISGMNDQGLTVTINAGKSSIPWAAKTPISILTREILQYASNIEEAIDIAKKRKVFVSESIFIGSAKDKRAVVIEVSPDKFGTYSVENSNQLICSNHFQSAPYEKDKQNQKQILESHSKYRYERMEELLAKQPKMTVKSAVEILRNTKGLQDKTIGYGNEKALNQLVAHHGIVFQPEDLKVWVSSNPYQLGEFVAYDLKTIFKKENPNFKNKSISKIEANIEKDPFLLSEAYRSYERYKKLRKVVRDAIASERHLDDQILSDLIASNPAYWETYYLIGLYHYNKGYDLLALNAFQVAENKEIATVPEKEKIQKYIKKLKRRGVLPVVH